MNRNESCGGHFREEYQTEEGEAKRDDEHYFYVACWDYAGNDNTAPTLIKEPLHYEAIKVHLSLAARSLTPASISGSPVSSDTVPLTV